MGEGRRCTVLTKGMSEIAEGGGGVTGMGRRPNGVHC